MTIMAAMLLVLCPDCPIVKDVDKLPPLPHQQTNSDGDPVGWLSAYGQMPTDATLEYGQTVLGLPHDISPYDGLIAVLDCGDVGKTARLKTSLGTFKMLIFDCAYPHDTGPEHLAGGARWMLENQYVGEVGFYFWSQYPELIGVEWVTLEIKHEVIE
jgi:hypothetical protein